MISVFLQTKKVLHWHLKWENCLKTYIYQELEFTLLTTMYPIYTICICVHKWLWCLSSFQNFERSNYLSLNIFWFLCIFEYLKQFHIIWHNVLLYKLYNLIIAWRIWLIIKKTVINQRVFYRFVAQIPMVLYFWFVFIICYLSFAKILMVLILVVFTFNKFY